MQAFLEYLKVLQAADRKAITEHTHRAELQSLLTFVKDSVNPKLKIMHEPKRLTDFGAPDFKITLADSIVGYVENKQIGANLSEVLKSEQIDKYKKLSDNIILTDYLDWVWLRKGKIEAHARLCDTLDLDVHRFQPDPEKIAKVFQLLSNFFSTAPEGIADPKKLATALASRAQLLKGFLWDELLRQQKEDTEGRLFGLYNTFKQLIDHELLLEDFTDTFAQMLVYGLFMARLNSGKDSIDLYNVEKYIPTSFELIRELVSFLKELNKTEYTETRWIVEEVLTVLNTMDSKAIHEVLSFNRKDKPRTLHSLSRHSSAGWNPENSCNTDTGTQQDSIQAYTAKDPYIYFYEDFLAAYDKKLRKAKGVYYTPLPVVNFIVRAINDVLKDTFGITKGLADHERVTVLDFAAGTGTFILEIVRQILDNSPESKRDLLIKEHILKNIYGFEYMIAPYTVAHLKLSQYIKDKGYNLSDTERFNVFLTNTLEHIETQKDMLLPALSRESSSALKVKDKPILVITGNPPYSYVSRNNGEFIRKLIKDYYFVDGKPLGERNPKGLQDDYVKFIRFAQWKMQNVDEGIVAIITNHAFLDNPTFRGMRRSLMQTFNQMYFLDLHGNSKKKEKAPDGGKDENVFDIMQGVAISIFVKTRNTDLQSVRCRDLQSRTQKASDTPNNPPQHTCQIKYAEIYGARQDKYDWLLDNNKSRIEWTELHPTAPQYLFTVCNEDLATFYNAGLSVQDIFTLSNVGIITARDKLTIKNTFTDMERVVTDFASLPIEDARSKYDLGDDSSDWSVCNAQKDIIDNAPLADRIVKVHYRPFDTKYTFYTGKSNGFISRPRNDVMYHMLHENLGLITVRQVAEGIFNHTSIVDSIVECRISLSNKGYGYLYPLYLYEEIDFLGTKQLEKKPNIKAEVIKSLVEKYKRVVSPEQIMSFIYAVLHSPTYRAKYADFLKTDFPRIPFTDDEQMFTRLAALGWDLMQAHLMKKPELNNLYKGMGDFAVKGSNEVDKVLYTEAQLRLYINSDQYFENIPEEVYNFYIGGYQVMNKYIKDRKGRTLNLDEINNVELIAKILAYTIDQMKEIDALTSGWI